MRVQVFIGGRPTTLQVFIGSMTRFAPGKGTLQIREVFVLAEDVERAREIAERHYPGWTPQTLTSLNATPWISAILLDENVPQVAELREWLLEHIEEGIPTIDI